SARDRTVPKSRRGGARGAHRRSPSPAPRQSCRSFHRERDGTRYWRRKEDVRSFCLNRVVGVGGLGSRKVSCSPRSESSAVGTNPTQNSGEICAAAKHDRVATTAMVKVR